jgi:hypothetical protein
VSLLMKGQWPVVPHQSLQKMIALIPVEPQMPKPGARHLAFLGSDPLRTDTIVRKTGIGGLHASLCGGQFCPLGEEDKVLNLPCACSSGAGTGFALRPGGLKRLQAWGQGLMQAQKLGSWTQDHPVSSQWPSGNTGPVPPYCPAASIIPGKWTSLSTQDRPVTLTLAARQR